MEDEKSRKEKLSTPSGGAGGFVHGFLYLLSLLPLRVLFIFSDLAYVLLYYVAGYRKKVVFSNLALAFPRKRKRNADKLPNDFIATSPITSWKQLSCSVPIQGISISILPVTTLFSSRFISKEKKVRFTWAIFSTGKWPTIQLQPTYHRNY
jgi:hypothetical protein